MRWILAVAAIAVLAVALAAASPASAKQLRCGAYAKNDGSLATSVVTNIAVVGMSCAAGQTVANGYHGLIGSFKPTDSRAWPSRARRNRGGPCGA